MHILLSLDYLLSLNFPENTVELLEAGKVRFRFFQGDHGKVALKLSDRGVSKAGSRLNLRVVQVMSILESLAVQGRFPQLVTI